VAGHLTKPVKQSDLFDAIVRALNLSSIRTKSGAGSTAPTAGPPPALPKLKILLAEDNFVNQQVAVRLLKRLGQDVTVAASGTEVLALLAGQRFDLVLMDVQMPDMDGFEATTRIREKENVHEHLPIIAMTAHAMKGDREHCLQAGMDDYVSKPIKAEELYSALARLFGKGAEMTGVSAQVAATPMIPPPLDPQTIDHLRQLAQAGDPAVLQEVFQAYLRDGRKYIAAIHQAVEAGDAKKLKQAAHALKGSSATIGAQGVAQIGQKLEEMGRTGVFLGAEGWLQQLDQEFSRVGAEIDRLAQT
jgi:CheY-like chemotaxis protein